MFAVGVRFTYGRPMSKQAKRGAYYSATPTSANAVRWIPTDNTPPVKAPEKPLSGFALALSVVRNAHELDATGYYSADAGSLSELAGRGELRGKVSERKRGYTPEAREAIAAERVLYRALDRNRRAAEKAPKGHTATLVATQTELLASLADAQARRDGSAVRELSASLGATERELRKTEKRESVALSPLDEERARQLSELQLRASNTPGQAKRSRG